MDAPGTDYIMSARRHPNARRMFTPINMAEPLALIMDEPASSRLALRASDNCSVLTDPNCNKSVQSSSYTPVIALAVIIPVAGIAITLFFLHRRHVRRQKAEDAHDPHASLDFGLGEVHRKKKNSEKDSTASASDFNGDEKRTRQLSMDMASPYLLPPELQNSSESLRSLSRIGHNPEDPYRQVTQYLADSGSVRSFRPHHDGSSIYTGSSGPSRLHETSTSDLLSNAQRMSRSYAPPARQTSLMNNANKTDPFASPLSPTPRGSFNMPVESPKSASPVQIPAAVAMPVPMKMPSGGLPLSPRPDGAQPLSLFPKPSAEMPAFPAAHSTSIVAELPTNAPMPVELAQPDASPTSVPIISLPSNPRPQRKQSLPVAQQAVIENVDARGSGSSYGDGFQVTPPSPGRDETRTHRYSMDVPPEEFTKAGLGAPGFDAKRLSMTFRPLPPDTLTAEVEDPETRANRIRSFYKEYFDDSKPAPQGQYYEDYDQNYMPDVAYFDPEQNNFVMPYAQPVTRRAMTPPPSSQRFMGQGQPGSRQVRSGSMGGGPPRGMPGGPRFMPPGGGSRPYSSASNRQGTPQGSRAGSSASGRMPQQRGRPLPPPEALTSLPTPSKLRDDSFALMNATDFAPPVSYRDRQAGRSASPLGDRRPYSPSVPSYKPLLTSFDEMSSLPSPHTLRKSGTFTSLDFAPPRRVFRDDGNASDAGSIRSNRSGVSAMQNDAIRKGAYRVSRLPSDAVPTKDDMADVLKPSWGMRPGV